LAAIDEIRGKRFLLLRAEIARTVLRDRLIESKAALVADVAIYQTIPAKRLPAGLPEALQSGQIQWVTFTSSSTAKNLAALLGDGYQQMLASAKLASIGPITTQTLIDLGLKPTIQAGTFDIDGIVDAIIQANSSELRAKPDLLTLE
jgi:uroporphyrinogen III methyltransferase/synthase